ncbi:proline hydroxylase [Noviherbaspirillum cavernae]|uniref:Proline hydroxylase n=2 Tax=Noviherbaspirillum cavernae TaxID=2320862 RepID=A0A418X6H4_9BURK|nr:proline hydroxylase [Noviherbaspirillum cavernae]
MAEVMVRDGRFSRMLADAAIKEARRGSSSESRIVKPVPDIDTSANTLQTPDRLVHVLTTFSSPRIVVLGNVLSDDECDALCAYTEQRLTRSPVVGDTDGGTQLHAHRTSKGAMLGRGETELIARIDARLAAIARWPVQNGEGLQVLRYEKGNEYRAHYDWFDPDQPGPRKHLEHGGQRVGTFVLYLCDVDEGGGTSFPNLGLEVQPRKGNAVFFRNTDDYGSPDRQTLHAGAPVVSGIKFVANKWLRERAY